MQVALYVREALMGEDYQTKDRCAFLACAKGSETRQELICGGGQTEAEALSAAESLICMYGEDALVYQQEQKKGRQSRPGTEDAVFYTFGLKPVTIQGEKMALDSNAVVLAVTGCREVSAFRLGDLAKSATLDVPSFLMALRESCEAADVTMHTDSIGRDEAPHGGCEQDCYQNLMLAHPGAIRIEELMPQG